MGAPSVHEAKSARGSEMHMQRGGGCGQWRTQTYIYKHYCQYTHKKLAGALAPSGLYVRPPMGAEEWSLI